ncbi:MAG: manganese efflux pump [Ruminococcus sp.]|nr:manganese efflux pump [Ruminococcus sp.]
MANEIIPAVIISFDTFLFAAAYRSGGIKIPLLSAFVINFICAAVFGISIYFSSFAGSFVSVGFCRLTGTVIMVAIGILTMVKSLVRNAVSRLNDEKKVSVKMGGLNFVIKLYLDDTAADTDHSKILSPHEAAALALSGSLDSAATGMGCGSSGINPVISALFTFIAGCAAVALGTLAGKKISSLEHDLSWLGGVMLIIFAVWSYIS